MYNMFISDRDLRGNPKGTHNKEVVPKGTFFAGNPPERQFRMGTFASPKRKFVGRTLFTSFKANINESSTSPWSAFPINRDLLRWGRLTNYRTKWV